MANFTSTNFANQKVLIRVDFNVPLNKQTLEINDDTRIKAAIPTIKKVLSDGGSVILMSHLGRPKSGPEDKFSLKHIVQHLQQLLNEDGTLTEVFFADDCIGDQAKLAANNLKPGQVLLLENLRFYKEEEAGDKSFAEKLASYANVWVNDAFGTAHRAHASTAIIAQFFPKDKRFFGFLMDAEVAAADKVLLKAEKPFTAIIGGAKVSDKILIIENLLERATDIIIGGGMAYTFMKAQGGNIGKSLCEDDRLDMANDLLEKAKEKGVNIHLPSDSIIADNFNNEANISSSPSNQIPDGWMGLDIGENACNQFANVILNSKTILWNGPMGVFEMSSFQNGTKTIAIAVANATEKGAYSLVGGGDSVSAVNKFGFNEKVSYVSTGGGAMLEFFEGKILPGIAAVNQE
ncbi:MAG: phosphoglycerate kinase [Chitinophagaceae bacterium]|nr:phosphoglycerate kinase [Chitinophagaceae bacterium]